MEGQTRPKGHGILKTTIGLKLREPVEREREEQRRREEEEEEEKRIQAKIKLRYGSNLGYELYYESHGFCMGF